MHYTGIIYCTNLFYSSNPKFSIECLNQHYFYYIVHF
uniref:Uncharacterized protein n=2 Tax=Anguilla anguilla TaxID=7936 RepID=A0A0E9R1X7_ANGAN